MKIKTFIMSMLFLSLLTAGVFGCYAINENAMTYNLFIQLFVHAFYIMMFVLAVSGCTSFITTIFSESITIKILSIVFTLGLIADAIIIIMKYQEFLTLVA